MKIKNDRLREFISDSDLVEKNKLEEAYNEAIETGKNLGDFLLEKKLIKDVDLRKAYAYVSSIPYVDLKKSLISLDSMRIIPESIAKKYKIIAFEKNRNNLKIAMLNPEDLQAVDFIKKKTGLKIIPHLASLGRLQAAIKQYEKILKAEFGDIIEKNSQEIKNKGEKAKDLEEIAQGIPVTRIIDTLLKHAILQSASDIHIEPEEKNVVVRYRINGVLHDAMNLPKEVLSGLAARIKVLSKLKLDEHLLPQDGRFKIENENCKFSFRVSIIPVFDGEKIVMRLLDESSKGLTLEKIGLLGAPLEIVHKEIKKTSGMVLVTGPAGSGRTTTLYTIMDIINTPKVNVSTVEDPVEYRMPRINQTEVDTKIGMTFSWALRALLRQDPDIIMAGEIRDKETLEVAIQAAMTGHLVLSAFHTDSAAEALARMMDMGAEPFLIASAVNAVIAQRLVRKLCPECRQEYTLTDKEIKTLKNSVNLDEILKYLKGNKESGKIIKSGAKWPDIKFYKAKGCEQCSNEGYYEKVGIFEVLETSEEIEKLIVASSPAETIEKAARKKGMATMIEDGFLKAARGITSIEEVLRVTKE